MPGSFVCRIVSLNAFGQRSMLATLLATLLLVFAAAAARTPAQALSKEQAQENCREIVRPLVRACMQGMSGDKEANREKCRAIVKASEKKHACVQAALNAANGRDNVPLALNKPTSDFVAPGTALPAGFVAPPRTIADIAAILDSDKPDPATLAKMQAGADAEPARDLAAAELAGFYYERAQARALLGRNAEALADGERAAAAANSSGDFYFRQRIEVFNRAQQMSLGDIKGALQKSLTMVKEANRPGTRGYLLAALRTASQVLVALGDVPGAEANLRRAVDQLREFRTSGNPQTRANYNISGRNWEGEVETLRAVIFEARGQLREAEQSYAKAREWKLAYIPDTKNRKHAPPEAGLRGNADANLLDVARMKAKQGRLAEAEVDARTALVARLKEQGKYNPLTTKFVMGLAFVLIEEGRYQEAERLTRTSLEIQRTIGIGDDTQYSAQILSALGVILTFERKQTEAVAVYAELDKAMAKWEPQRRAVLELNGSRINALLASGQTEAGLAAARALVKREVARVGENHFDTASAHGILAVALMRAGNDAEAVSEFKAALPILRAAARENADDEDATLVAGRTQRLQYIVEAYIKLLANMGVASGDAAAETFSLADSIRGHSVQQALAQSSVRASVKDPALGELVRREQDLSKQVSAQLGLLNNILALPSAERDEKGVRDVNASIEKLRAGRDKAHAEINKRFPAYADLVDPKAPSVDQVRATLAEGEAMLSFYFGRNASFVWAVPKEGAVAFAAINATSGDIESKVRKLREALEPQAVLISDIPPFDVKLGYELYSLLLSPVEAGWKQSKSLIVVTNGALGLLPLSLLRPPPPK